VPGVKKLARRAATALFIINALFVGAAIFARRLIPTHGDETTDTFAVLASMSGVEFRSAAAALSSAEATALLGGIELDLRGAQIVDGARLVMRAVLGGIALVVPPGWRVEVRRRVLAGEVEVDTDPDAAGDDAPLLVIDAAAYFGGITIGTKEPVPA
jgi:hypothetical protein